MEVKKRFVSGSPDLKRASTNYVEIQDLIVGMSTCRFTRLTNGFFETGNLSYASALYFVYYNFRRTHTTSRAAPTEISKQVWGLKVLLKLNGG